MAVQKTGAAGQKTEYVLVPKTELEALRRRAADVEILQRKVDVLQELALKDPLTRAGNRRARDERLSIEKSKMTRAKKNGEEYDVAYLVFDLDGFKTVNDTLGHDAGDALLKKFTEILKAHTRTSDLVCRHGGDEFAVILSEENHDGAKAYAGRINSALASVDGLETSFGICTLKEANGNIDVMLKLADAGMYDLKNQRRG